MLEWLKSKTGKPSAENRAGLSASSLALLRKETALLDSIHPGLGEPALVYLLDGEAAEILVELSRIPDLGQKMGLAACVQTYGSPDRSDRREFFATLKIDSIPFLLRLARFYGALAGPGTRFDSPSFLKPDILWIEVFLGEAFAVPGRYYFWSARKAMCPALTAPVVESILVEAGEPPETLIHALLEPGLPSSRSPHLKDVFERLDGLAALALKHAPSVAEVLARGDARGLLHILEMFATCHIPPGPFLPRLTDLALDSRKQVQRAAEALLRPARLEALPGLRHRIEHGTNAERLAAARLLWQWGGENELPFLKGIADTCTHPRTKQGIEVLLAPVPTDDGTDSDPPLPPLAPQQQRLPLGAETEKAWHALFDSVAAAIDAHNAQQGKVRYFHAIKPLHRKDVGEAFRQVQFGSERSSALLSSVPRAIAYRPAHEALLKFWGLPELQPLHLVRFTMLCFEYSPNDPATKAFHGYQHWLESLLPSLCRNHPETGLRELGAAFETAGFPAQKMAEGLLGGYQAIARPFQMNAERIWPFWAEQIPTLERAFEPAIGDWNLQWERKRQRANAFSVLALFPRPPAALVPRLWELALSSRAEGAVAQRALEGLPDRADRLMKSLPGGAAESRLAAANWLGRLGDARAVDPLLGALKCERNEATRGAIMSALERLGVPVEQFLDRQGLLKEAGKYATLPETLAWFPLANLPTVNWTDGRPVDPAIVRAWLHQTCKLKNPEPGPLLRRYCEMIVEEQRHALGLFILEAWMAHDTMPIPPEEAARRAHSHAQAYFPYLQKQPGNQHRTIEDYEAAILPTFLAQTAGSAIASKGILALAGACAGGNAVPVVHRYLKQWYGMRAAQCRALLQMLSRVEHKTAIQLLLAVGTRFRTKGIQEEANRLALALAERRGWTLAELADRTIPMAGLDDDGVLTLDFGRRQFRATLTESLDFVLSDTDGKVLKKLPDTRKDDDADMAAAARKRFMAARKELKTVIDMQRDRLYEAMCTERSWPYEDWQVHLNRHPIVRHHCQRLVWTATLAPDRKDSIFFRSLPDGSLTDADDNPLELREEHQVRVAHQSQVDRDLGEKWQAHLLDYEVDPLFVQFGRDAFTLPDERSHEAELTDFTGCILEAFKLRGRATRLGYVRGPAEDGGWFHHYVKRFPTLHIETVLEFTGNPLPEENRTVALTGMHFEHREPDGPHRTLLLSEIPVVLLSECWGDMKQIAGEGPGFDPDWQKKTEY